MTDGIKAGEVVLALAGAGRSAEVDAQTFIDEHPIPATLEQATPRLAALAKAVIADAVIRVRSGEATLQEADNYLRGMLTKYTLSSEGGQRFICLVYGVDVSLPIASDNARELIQQAKEEMAAMEAQRNGKTSGPIQTA